MAYHVIYKADGTMWQSFEAPTPDLPAEGGYFVPSGGGVKTFAAPPAAGQAWDPATLTFVYPTVVSGAVTQFTASQLSVFIPKG